jgi:MraZ protein
VIAYVGEFHHTCDDQGRVNIPSKFRDILKLEESTLLIALKGFERCVALVPASDWANYQAWITSRRIEADREGRFFRRALLRGSEHLQPDGQGRVQLNKTLRAYAGIERDVVVYGVGAHIEIWAAEHFDEYMTAGESAGVSLEESAPKFMWRDGSDVPGSNR